MPALNPLYTSRINRIGTRIHKKFQETIYENLEDDYLISIFNQLEEYWFDNYRSTLIWFCNKISGGDPEKTIIPSLIMSLTSSGIGIHDDIIDKTYVKNYQFTVPGRFDQKTALIAADLLIVKGLLSAEMLVQVFNIDTYHSLITVLRKYFTEIAVAEIWEINANKKIDIELKTYHDMLWKLGADIEVCAKMGAISADASEDQVQVLSIYGRSIGYLIRLRDELRDIIDIEGNFENRVKNESIPLGLIYASTKSDIHYKEIKDIIEKEEIKSKDIKKLLNICRDSLALEYIKKNINDTSLKIQKKMDYFSDSEAKNMLIYLLKLIIQQTDIEQLKKEKEITKSFYRHQGTKDRWGRGARV